MLFTDMEKKNTHTQHIIVKPICSSLRLQSTISEFVVRRFNHCYRNELIYTMVVSSVNKRNDFDVLQNIYITSLCKHLHK